MLTSRTVGFFLTALALLFILLVSRDHYAFTDTDHGDNSILLAAPSPSPQSQAIAPQQSHYRADVELVVASTSHEDTSWLPRYLPDVRAHVYVVDADSKSQSHALTVPRNKGREAMVYLTHIIDTYDLTSEENQDQVLVFLHASRFAWHNDDPDYDALPALQNLQLPHVRRTGYANLRCVWVIGCPAEMHPLEDEGHTAEDGALTTKGVYRQAWDELQIQGEGEMVPETVAVSCCSQFAVTRQTIRQRPKEDYVRFREWLLKTPLEDALSGRVFEFSWHIIFGKEAVHCPSAAECYCNTFGLFCDIAAADCTDGDCPGHYTLPPFSTLPSGWPVVGWEQEERNFTGPLD